MQAPAQDHCQSPHGMGGTAACPPPRPSGSVPSAASSLSGPGAWPLPPAPQHSAPGLFLDMRLAHCLYSVLGTLHPRTLSVQAGGGSSPSSSSSSERRLHSPLPQQERTCFLQKHRSPWASTPRPGRPSKALQGIPRCYEWRQSPTFYFRVWVLLQAPSFLSWPHSFPSPMGARNLPNAYFNINGTEIILIFLQIFRSKGKKPQTQGNGNKH